MQEAKQHRSVQQGLQMHGLLAGGGAAFERLLPGFRQQCVSSGAKYVPDNNVQVGKQISMVSRDCEECLGEQAVTAGPTVEACATCACNIIIQITAKVREQSVLIKQMLQLPWSCPVLVPVPSF